MPILFPVVMAGGSGTRLWPLSRSRQPKQFLSLAGDATMLQETVLRLSEIGSSCPTVICNEENRFFVAEQLREIDQLGPILLEPVGRNTSPAIALAALNVSVDSLLLVLAADHVITNQQAFTAAVNREPPPKKYTPLFHAAIFS